MDLFELVEKLKNCTDEAEAYVLNSMIEETAKGNKESLKENLENGELGTTTFSELGKELNVVEISKATLKADDIKAKLSDEECRKGLKITEKLLKDLKRNDLLKEGYKTFEVIRQIRVTTIKAEEKSA